MPSSAPGAERLAGGVEGDAVPVTASRSPAGRARRRAGLSVFLLVIVVLFDVYLHLSKTYPENSDEANILLMANDMLHGNVYLSGWKVSDVPFISTELPEITLLVWLFGLHLNTAHIAAALTYTLVVAVGMLLAKGRASGPQAIARMALALAIMLAPQPGIGIFVVIFSVGHIGTALPVMLTWLVLDRLGRRWYVPLIVTVLLGWALMADPLVLVIAIFPMLAVCLARVLTGLVAGARDGGGRQGLRQRLRDRQFELSLAAAAGMGYLVAWLGGILLRGAGGYQQNPVPFKLAPANIWFMHARVTVHGLLEMFGAYFVPGNAINYLKGSGTKAQYLSPQYLSGLNEAIAITHVAGVVMAIWGAFAIARRFFFRDADIISQLLLAGIIANLAAYITSTLANATALNVREVAPVLPFAAVLAARMLGDRLLSGPVAAIRLPRLPQLSRLPRLSRLLQLSRLSQLSRSGQPVRLRLLAIPLVALFGWYSFGVFNQAATPAAPNPLAPLEAFLEANHLTYGVSGYWNASVITVGTGGAVQIRAITPSCMQPYTWESKPAWYDPARHQANFLVMSKGQGYFKTFSVSPPPLKQLAKWDGYPKNPRWPLKLQKGNYKVWVYPANLLSQVTSLYQVLNAKPVDQSKPAGPGNPRVQC